MSDTYPDIVREFHARLVERTGEERMRMGADMFINSMVLMRAGITAKYVEMPEITVREILLDRLYGDKLSAEAQREIAI